MRLIPALLLLLLAAAAPAPFVPVTYGQDDLAHILAAKSLRCGTVTNEADYSPASTHGNLAPFARDLCEATGVALFGAPGHASLDGFPDDGEGLRALHEGHIDVLFGVTPDAASALPYAVTFAPTAFFDSQGFLVARNSGITKPAQLSHKLLCFITGTTEEARMNRWRAQSGTAFWAHDFQERGEMSAALEDGKCAAITDDVSELATMRAAFSRPAAEFTILPQRIAIDPWAPAYRAGQVRLGAVLTDVLHALIRAEELGVTADNLAHPPASAAILLGATPGIAATLGMPNGWARRALAAHGNYAEIFDATLGKHSDMNLERGPDALWSEGGMLAAPTLR